MMHGSFYCRWQKKVLVAMIQLQSNVQLYNKILVLIISKTEIQLDRPISTCKQSQCPWFQHHCRFSSLSFLHHDVNPNFTREYFWCSAYRKEISVILLILLMILLTSASVIIVTLTPPKTGTAYIAMKSVLREILTRSKIWYLFVKSQKMDESKKSAFLYSLFRKRV